MTFENKSFTEEIYPPSTMKTQGRAIILLQCLKNKEDFNFNSSLMTYIQEHFGQAATLFSLDSFSDGTTTHYTKSLLDQSEEVILICELDDCESLGAIQAILNYAIRKKNVRLLSKGENQLLNPFMKFLNGGYFQSNEELSTLLK